MSDVRTAGVKRRTGKPALGYAVALVVMLALVPVFAQGSLALGQYGVALLYVIAAIGLNLAMGYSGVLAIGTSTIMGVAAYTAGLCVAAGMNSILAGGLAILAGALAGFLMVLPGLRVQGWYLALITLFSVMVLPGVVTLAEHWTGGEYGLTGIAPLSIFGYSFGPVALYELTVGAFALVWVCAANLTQSAWGYRFKLLRDAPRAGEAVGINLNKVRLVVYAWSSIPPALAGVMMAYTNRFVGYQSFGIGLTLFLLTGVVLGGGGSVWGPIIGMAPLVVLSLFVGPFSEYNAIGLAVGLLISSIVFTNGIVPEIVKRYQRRFPADAAAPPTAEMAEKRAAMFRNQTGSTRPVHPGPALEVTDVRKRFDGLQALDGVRFTLSKGTLCGLVGPNGCGKSTFLNTICGFVTPDTGSIAVNGRATTALPPHALLGMGVGRSFQVPQLVGDMTVLENIESGLIGDERGRLWSSLLRTPAIRQQEARRREMAFAAFDEVGLPRSILHMKAEELSLGMKRLVEIGRAIAAHPSLLLLDEPAAGLNNTERSELGLLLRRLKTDGMTILVIEHNVPFVLDFCDEILLMQAGTIVTHASRSDKLPAQLLEYLNYGLPQTTSAGMAEDSR